MEHETALAQDPLELLYPSATRQLEREAAASQEFLLVPDAHLDYFLSSTITIRSTLRGVYVMIDGGEVYEWARSVRGAIGIDCALQMSLKR